MTSLTIDARRRMIQLSWADGASADYPFLWLRDNCPSGFHPQTEERTFDLLSVPADIAPAAANIEDGHLVIIWDRPRHVSRFPLGWLKDHRPGYPMPDPADVPAVLWRGTLAPEDLPCADATAVMTDDGALLEWLKAGRAYGLALIDGLPDDAEAGMALAQRIGFLRETNFGTTFDVVSKPDPNNLAYTAHHLPVHTDLTNQETPPGFQFLHCLSNDAVGGGSVFCDGFAVADDIRLSDPEAFSLLCETVIPMRFHDENTDIRHRGTVIRTTDRDVVREIRFNAHLAGIFDLPADEMERYYRAYRTYMAATRSPDYSVSLTLKAGQLVVFDNRRVLHGREAFDPSTGFRRLRGCYVDRGEWNSRIRVLSRRDADTGSATADAIEPAAAPLELVTSP